MEVDGRFLGAQWTSLSHSQVPPESWTGKLGWNLRIILVLRTEFLDFFLFDKNELMAEK